MLMLPVCLRSRHGSSRLADAPFALHSCPHGQEICVWGHGGLKTFAQDYRCEAVTYVFHGPSSRNKDSHTCI